MQLLHPVMQRVRSTFSNQTLFAASLIGVLSILGASITSARAAPVLRFKTDEHGSFVTFGNSGGFNCDTGASMAVTPTVGSVDRAACGMNTTDHGIDVLWRSDEPAAGMVLANTTIQQDMARTTAVLQLPNNATVVYARLYWASTVTSAAAVGKTVTLERPGLFAKTITADPTNGTISQNSGGVYFYQSTAEITKEVQAAGAGAFRVGGIATQSPTDLNLDTQFIGWTAVVFYRLATDPTRNLALFDGFDLVNLASPATATLSGFLVPASGFDAKLGVVAYQGDNDLKGDALLFNTTALSNGLNDADNVFNSSHTDLGTAVTVAGDLPQTTGAPASMSGLDIDTFDITALVHANDTSAVVSATSALIDTYFVSSFVTAISTLRPVFSSTSKTFRNLTRADGNNLPGDIIEYTITTQNTGSDSGVDVILSDKLPAGETYVPGTLMITAGANSGNLTDQALDDQGEYVDATRTVTVRLGTGANTLTGGTITTTDAATVVKFRVKLNASAGGTINNLAQIAAQGQTAVSMADLSISTWNSGDGTNLNVPTPIIVDGCLTNNDCSASAPICDTTQSPKKCVCQSNTDCPGAQICDTTGSHTCVACTASSKPYCDPDSVGGVCLTSGPVKCGCSTNADCDGRTCDTETGTCPMVSVDLGVILGVDPGGSVSGGQTLTYTVTLSNPGTLAVNGAQVSSAPPAGITGITWTCATQGSAMCLVQSGSGALPTAVNLPAGSSLIYTVLAPLPSPLTGTSVDYGVTLMAPNGFTDSNLADNSATVSSPIVGGQDLSVTITQPSQSNADGSLSYGISVNNAGPSTVPQTLVVYNLPTGADYVGGSGDGWACTQNQALISCASTTPLAVGLAPMLTITVRQSQGSTLQSLPYTFTVTGEAADGSALPDSDPSNNTASGTTALAKLELSGGGFGCSLSGTEKSSPAMVAGIFAMMIAAMLRRRRLLTVR